MKTAILNAYEKLNTESKKFIDTTIEALAHNEKNTIEPSAAEKKQIEKQHHEEAIRKQKERERLDVYIKELNVECDNMSKQDYIVKLNELFIELPDYKLRFYYRFIKGTLQ